MRGLVEMPELGDLECTVVYPAISFIDEPLVGPERRVKGSSPSGPAAVAVLGGNLVFVGQLQIGSTVVPIGGFVEPGNVRATPR